MSLGYLRLDRAAGYGERRPNFTSFPGGTQFGGPFFNSVMTAIIRTGSPNCGAPCSAPIWARGSRLGDAEAEIVAQFRNML